MEKADEDKKDTQETERKRREGRIDKKRANDRDRGISEEKYLLSLVPIILLFRVI